jgi:hypothetical protein
MLIHCATERKSNWIENGGNCTKSVCVLEAKVWRLTICAKLILEIQEFENILTSSAIEWIRGSKKSEKFVNWKSFLLNFCLRRSFPFSGRERGSLKIRSQLECKFGKLWTAFVELWLKFRWECLSMLVRKVVLVLFFEAHQLRKAWKCFEKF